MSGCRFLVAIEKSHKPYESHTSKGTERICAQIINTPGILPVSRSVYKYTMCVCSLVSVFLSLKRGFIESAPVGVTNDVTMEVGR